MDYTIYEIRESMDDGLDQLIDILKEIRVNNGGVLDFICHNGNLEVIDDYGNTICEISI